MIEYMKLEPGQPGYLADFPQMCICGSQKGPMVATGQTYRAAPGPVAEATGHVYLCRLCVTRAARALGMVKGDEMDRLQHASDELAQAQQEITTRQEMLDRNARTLGENEAKIQTQRAFIEQLQGEIALCRQQAHQIAATAREMTTA